MKILQVIPYFCFGGAEIMCENLTCALRKMGHDVLVVSLFGEHTPISDRMERAGFRIVFLDKKPGLDVSMIPKLHQIMKCEKPDVVHTHLNVIKYAVPAARLAGVKRCVHTVHSVAGKEAEGKLQKISNWLYYHLGWSVPVALSPAVQQTVCDVYRMKKENVPVVYNGIDLSRYSPRDDYALTEAITIVHIGRFVKSKNHEGLLRVFTRMLDAYPNCRLELIGDGELRSEIENQIRQLGLSSRVVLHGMQSDICPYLHRADLFVLPSRYEGMPMTLIEAMATGLPICATAVGGIPDMVTDGGSAMLVPCEEDAIFNACSQLLGDAALRKRMGRAALRESVRFSDTAMAEKYCEIYKDI